MSRSTEYISNTMSLREPLKQSLQVLENLLNQSDLIGESEILAKESIIKNEYPLFEEFERGFPSVCYSIATGIGKTRLMGAFVTYLAKEKGIKNFFILSPNITIYDKLKDDFGNKGAAKYVFKGLPEISNNAVIITGEDYETKGIKASEDSIQINMFTAAICRKKISPWGGSKALKILVHVMVEVIAGRATEETGNIGYTKLISAISINSILSPVPAAMPAVKGLNSSMPALKIPTAQTL